MDGDQMDAHMLQTAMDCDGELILKWKCYFELTNSSV